jgi:hypothetical protein
MTWQVRRALGMSEDHTESIARPLLRNLSPSMCACSTPRVVSGESRLPWYRPATFHSVCPWRTRRNTAADAVAFCGALHCSEVTPPGVLRRPWWRVVRHLSALSFSMQQVHEDGMAGS